MENQFGEFSVKIRVDEKISPAMFKADPLIPGGYIANSLTIRALRTDLQVDAEFDIKENEYVCGCGKELDKVFWKLCPYCAREIIC